MLITNTPSVWVALRETEFTGFPDYGNYEFWLYQNDAVPGGRTVPLWNVGTAYQGRYTRRTDQGSGNANMYFDVNDRYAAGGHLNAIVSVTYYDQGTDRWELWYDSVQGNERLGGSVQKRNTRTWQTATLVLDDARFSNGLPGGGDRPGSDFRIWSAGDGDETIHLVDVIVRAGTSRTLSLRQGVNGYAGMSDLYIDSAAPDQNTNNLPKLMVFYQDIRHSLLRFDLAALPANSIVTTATLELYQYGSSGLAPMTLNAHRVLCVWAPSTATWNQLNSTTRWEKPGASGSKDRETVTAGAVELLQTSGLVELNITPLVQAWLDQPALNYGLLLRGISDRGHYYAFYSSESGDVNVRPRLVIQYQDRYVRPPTATPTGTTRPTVTPTVSPTPTVTPVPRTLVSRQITGSPVIDGDLAEWTQAEQAALDANNADHLEGEKAALADSSTVVRSLWNDEWLFLAASINDDLLYRDSAEIWHDDSIELALDGANDQIGSRGDDHQFTIASDGLMTDFGVFSVPAARLAVRPRPGGYDVELAIPSAYVNAGDFFAGKIMGFTIGLIDDDNGGKREACPIATWCGKATTPTTARPISASSSSARRST